MLKKLIAHSLVFSLVLNNLAFATQSIIELDVQGSQTSQRLHTILPSYKIEDVSHVEIDTENRQVSVHRIEDTKLTEEGKDCSSVHSETIKTHPVILQKYNVINLPWDLDAEILKSFLLQHTAWLTSLGEDGYKLEFKGGLLGGGGVQSTGGGGNRNCDCTPITGVSLDTNKVVGVYSSHPYSPCPNTGNDFGRSQGKSGGNDKTGGYGSSVISKTGNGSRTSPIDTLQEQGIFLNRPLSVNDYIKKNAFLPKDYMKDILLDDALLQVVIDYNKGISSPMKMVLEPLGYIARQDLRNILNYVAVSKDYLSPLTKNELQHRLQSLFDLHIQYVSPDCWGVGPGSNCFHWGQIQKQNKNSAISKVLAPRLMSKGLNLIMTKGETLSGKTGRDAPKWGENSHHALSVFHPSTGLAYPVFVEDRGKMSVFLPVFYTPTSHADYLVTETSKIVERNHIPDKGGVVAFAYVTNNTLREVLEEASCSSTSVYTKDGFNKRLQEAFLLHNQYSGNKSLPKVGGTKGIDAQVFMIDWLMPRLRDMALSLGGSSKTLTLPNFEGLSQGLNKNNHLSIYSAFTNLHYPVFTEDRGKEGSLLPVTYKPTKESDYLIKYTKGYVVDSNKIKHHVEELQAIGYLVHEAMEQAVEDCRNGDAWDKQEFYTCLKAMTLHHLQMSGAEWVNTKMGGYFTEQLLPRIIYQAAFHHARIPENKEPFDDQIMKEWVKTDWIAYVQQVKLKGDANLKDMIGLGGEFGGGGFGNLRGIQNFKNAPPVLQRQPDFKWSVKEANVAGAIKGHDKFGKIYRDPTQKVGNKEIWWSKDIGGKNAHSGEHYKLFEQTKNGMQWIADVDLTGKVILKHKGKTGYFIPNSELWGIK